MLSWTNGRNTEVSGLDIKVESIKLYLGHRIVHNRDYLEVWTTGMAEDASDESPRVKKL